MKESKTEVVKAIAKGDFKSIPGVLCVNYLDNKEVENILIDAGMQVAEYERDASEESELRKVVFRKENMRILAKHMQPIDDFSWMDELHNCIENILSESAMTEANREACEKHFCEIVRRKIRSQFPSIFERSQQDSIAAGVVKISSQMADMHHLICNAIQMQEEKRQHQRQEYSEYRENETEESDFIIPKWHLKNNEVQGIFKPKEERQEEICNLITVWGQEREDEPGWYILPYKVCEELSHKTQEWGLLQSHTWIDQRTMLLYAYELVWRYEKCLHFYYEYEVHHIVKIWENFYSLIIEKCNQEVLSEDETKADIKKWFYIGQVLLRIFRENGADTDWKRVYDLLKSYEEYGTNGKVDLQLEKAKYEFYHLHIPALRREISKCRPQKEQYEQRLQLLGLRVECGEAEAVIPEIRQLMKDLEGELMETGKDSKYQVFCRTLKVCSLQLLSLCVQGVHDYEEKYEVHQEEINQILEEMEQQARLFDWNQWESGVEHALLKWHTKKYETSEAFDLNQEKITLFSSGNCCEKAYRFYRVLESLALPLHCGYVNLLGEMEQPWIEALAEMNPMLGVFVLIRSNRSSNIKALINRNYVTMIEQEQANDITALLLNTIAMNLDEIDAQESNMENALISSIQSNVPELLIRFMSRCPDYLQQQAMLLVKQLMEDEELPVSFPIAELMIGILTCVSEKQKAMMLGIMIKTKIYEHKTLQGHGNGIDIFDSYFNKTDIGEWKKYCVVDPCVIEQLLSNSSNTDYEWRTKVTRLTVLDKLGLLNEEQRHAYAKLIWSNVSKETGLPNLPNLQLFSYNQLPCIEAAIPVQSIKKYFLNQKLSEQFKDIKGCRFTWGDIPYLDELILLCQNVNRDYWTKEEAENLLKNIIEYWQILREKKKKNISDGAVEKEYNVRAEKMIKAAAGICQNLFANLDDSLHGELKQMMEEMQQCGISTRKLEVQVSESDLLIEKVKEEMQSADEELAVGAVSAAYQYIRNHPAEQSSQDLLNEILQILCYRKTPGLVSAIWVIHNLAYEKNSILNNENLELIDKYLKELAITVTPDRNERGARVKDILNVRRACAALAFQMYHMDEIHAGKGVLLWKDLTAKGEVNEVKNQWVW